MELSIERFGKGIDYTALSEINKEDEGEWVKINTYGMMILVHYLS